MTKYAPLFLIVLLFNCAGDADLLDEAVYVQKIVEVEIREPEGDEEQPPAEVSMPNPSEIVGELIASDQELASFFCNGTVDGFSNVEQGLYLKTETSDINFIHLTANELQVHSGEAYGPSVFRNYILEGVLKSDSSSDFENRLIEDLQTLRQSNLKAIIGFSYAPSFRLSPKGKASRLSYEAILKERLLSRISKFSYSLKNNADVVTCVQIGFVGS